ncbi:MAG: endopeptidase La, partial [Planctomycetota bacterium]|nr:endopeptidase La [Planctomycetota bacterium]
MAASSGSVRGKKDTAKDYLAVHLLSTVVFPHDVVSLHLPEDNPACRTLLDAEDREVVAILSKRGAFPPQRLDEVRPVAVVCRVAQSMLMPGGGVQIVFQGLRRVRLAALHKDGEDLRAEVRAVAEDRTDAGDPHVLDVLDLLSEYLARDGSYPESLDQVLRLNLRSAGRFADQVAASLHLPLAVKRDIACTTDAGLRLRLLADAIEEEIQRSLLEANIHDKVRTNLEQRQKEQYLRQQIKAIRHELGDEKGPEEEADAFQGQLEKARLPKEAKEVAQREIRRLQNIPVTSAEYQVVRSYVEWLLDLPWRKRTRDTLDLKQARRTLDEDHTGLEKVKERILEHLAVRQLKKDMRSPILCLVGPPGVGKTSLGKSVARTLGRKFLRMSVGGLRDESEIKGHRRTYVGAMPGKIMQMMRTAGVRNPVLQIDEIDKMGTDARGDPASALLETLDPEVHSDFRDHYIEVGFDLSEVFFLVTANLLDTIPPALRDRLEVIRLEGYTREEKLAIAKKHLVPKALDEHGLPRGSVQFTRPGLGAIVDGYTREAGLRELERNLNKICRKVATRWVDGDKSNLRVGPRRVPEMLGARRFRSEIAGRSPKVGVSTGLAWTSAGGQLLFIEANRMPGKGDVQITGQLGEVMRESVQAALSFIRSHAVEFELGNLDFSCIDLHVHFPDGATPKDGPSAGVAVAACLVSLLTGRPARADLAMTGEITLKGKVLEVGGIKEKLLAAHRAGIRQVLVPQDNLKDLEDVPAEVLDDLEVMGTEDVIDNISEALLNPRTSPTQRPRGVEVTPEVTEVETQTEAEQ